jgi:large subunit ribosomal protein L10
VLKSDKETSIEEIKERLDSAKIAILTEFQGMTVAETNELRKLFREADISYKVYKNTLMGIAAQELGLSGLDNYLVGTTALAVSEKNDLVAPAKIVKNFSAKHQNFKVKGGILEKKTIDPNGVIQLASMPPKEVLMAMVLGGMQAPISRLLSVLQGNIRNFLFVLKSIAEQKEKNSLETKQDNTTEITTESAPEQKSEENQGNQEES